MRNIIQLLLVSSLMACGTDGSMGPIGPEGPRGPAGPDGSTNILAFASITANAVGIYTEFNFSDITHTGTGQYHFVFAQPPGQYGAVVTPNDNFVTCSVKQMLLYIDVVCVNFSHIFTDVELNLLVFG